ncbi:hypothetical protein ORV05_35935 [Amycolatopsis cynarae]|uniref:Uncharacterized protein n=1 Tax=Amycolatopsis cynarae TaxID=2995223 RepID=A0ABY7B1V0_9PSEU|nr:hypothetical protein [Amycolatopsis sp. HUAS 11-8]WAL66171.1 hypothetical protein ORV05_35935 [Amycolatopsis sp. HUAS 11-8]
MRVQPRRRRGPEQVVSPANVVRGRDDRPIPVDVGLDELLEAAAEPLHGVRVGTSVLFLMQFPALRRPGVRLALTEQVAGRSSRLWWNALFLLAIIVAAVGVLFGIVRS